MADVDEESLVTATQRFAGELLFLVAIAVFGVAFYRSMDGLREIARAFPLFALALLGLLVALNLIGATKKWISARNEAEGAGDLLAGLGRNLARGRSSIIVFVSLVAFTWLIPRLGFFAAQAVFLAALGFGLGLRPKSRIGLLVASTVIVSYLLFSTLLGVRLPSGLLL